MEDRIINLIQNMVEDDTFNVTLESNLFKDCKFGSIEFVTLLSNMEEEFDFEMDTADIDMKKIRYLRYVVELVKRSINYD